VITCGGEKKPPRDVPSRGFGRLFLEELDHVGRAIDGEWQRVRNLSLPVFLPRRSGDRETHIRRNGKLRDGQKLVVGRARH
jgi:hypothetical protein